MKHVEIGIDLGEYEIKIVTLNEMPENINKLKDFKTYPVDSKMYSKEYFETVKSAIKDFSKKIKSSRLSLNFAVPYTNKSKLTILTVPMVEEKDLNTGIKFEVEQQTGEKFLGHKTLWKKSYVFETDNKMEILFSAMQSSLIASISKFKTINWKINKVIFQPVVLERLSKGNDVIIDFGYKKTKLYLYKEGRLREVEAFDFGYKGLEDKVTEYMKENEIPLEEEFYDFVDKLYIPNGFDENDVVLQVSSHVEPYLRELVSELKRSVRSFELKNGLDIDSVKGTGSLFNYKHFKELLSSELDMFVAPLEVVSKDTADTKYEIASAVALSEQKKEKLNYAQFVKMNIDYPSIAVGLSTIALTSALILAGLNTKYDNLVSEQDAITTKQTNTIMSLERKNSEYENIIMNDRNFLTVVDTMKNENYIWISDTLAVIPKLTPLTISITSMDLTSNSIVIQGLSSDYSSIGFFAKKLEPSGTVEIQTIEDYESTDTVYSVTKENPTDISDKYIMTQKFQITVSHNGLNRE